MAIDTAKLLGWHFPELDHQVEPRDVMLYALAVGLGSPATDRRQLPFVYEEGLKALPMMANVMGYRGFWLKNPATGVDWRKVLHVQQRIVLHANLPTRGTIRSRQQVSALVDKGTGKGAFIVTRRDISDPVSGRVLAEVEQTNMLRADGGFGTSSGTLRILDPVPERAPDHIVDLPVLEQAALLYRLCGDYNPLHADPDVALSAGFERPILHGLCTFAMVGHAVLDRAAGYAPERLTLIEGRFSAPLFPGETLRVELWDEGSGQIFARARAAERDVIVFDRGRAEIGAA
ncbi:MaoC family dehydratase [Sphingobium phenoxybenzoativorans]|uniref:MaoC family dehydratase n=1 Tax=Sphingobium phenoxybenzoativorans TaxID=1592790 RepID=UPI00087203C1|nr:MaoC family dehydratase [Sphingobium phenoxybenzoativorans]